MSDATAGGIRAMTRQATEFAAPEEATLRRPRSVLPLAGLGEADQRRMVALATLVCPGSDAYLMPRLRSYAYAITADDERGLAAFELLDEFGTDAERFVYLGPLFSRDGACVALISGFVQALLDAPRCFHLLSEVQNPEAALLFKALFPTTSYPAFGRRAVPAWVQEIAARFARELRHIQNLDTGRLATSCTTTLFRRRPGCEAVQHWMESRGVFLDRGDSQVFVVSCASPETRSRLAADVRRSRQRFRHWKQWRPRMLARFARAACHD
ncbi:MAG: hypothetical protein AB1452_06745 [Pseudomonadota bacterium]